MNFVKLVEVIEFVTMVPSFSERAKAMDVLIVPSNDFGMDGYARLSYCVETEMIERALPRFKKIIEGYKND